MNVEHDIEISEFNLTSYACNECTASTALETPKERLMQYSGAKELFDQELLEIVSLSFPFEDWFANQMGRGKLD